jgi:hypothetical protein
MPSEDILRVPEMAAEIFVRPSRGDRNAIEHQKKAGRKGRHGEPWLGS